MKKTFLLSFWLVLPALMLFTGCERKVTLESLLREMSDRENLTRFPQRPYKLLQFSSYNRDSKSPGLDSWYANSDMSHFIRVENTNGRREFVLFDASGPGAIVRWWMTFYMAQKGIIRVYLDQDPVPAIQGRPDSILSGNGLAGPPFAVSVHRGVIIREKGRDLDHNLYLPVPFARHCKITYECDSLVKIKEGYYYPDVFYNIDGRQYDAGTAVKTFSMKELLKARPALEKAAKELLNDNIHSAVDKEFDQKIRPGESYTVHFGRKRSAVNYLALKITARDTLQALRSTVFSASFDGHQTIWVPAGEFFGVGYRKVSHATWMNRSDNKGKMESYWVMPFRDRCDLIFINYGRETISVSGKAGLSDYSWKSGSLYFGASWHEYYHLPTRNEKGSFFDLNFADVMGEGIYAGDQVTVFNTSYEWWGEGDEKIFVDGESFPSIFGTGSEDYYGYGFGRPDPFSHPFISQPVGEGNEGNTDKGGLTVNMRHRSLDAIPFKKIISANIELWHWAPTLVNYALTSYWYVKLPFEVNIKPDVEGVRHKVARSTDDFDKAEIKRVRNRYKRDMH
jgi:hypothetical protein